MRYGLPTTVNIGEEVYDIRTDFRMILEIVEVINDPELENAEKLQCILVMFYPEWESIRDVEAAVKECFRFIDMGGEAKRGKGPRLMDWENDFDYIIAPVNRVLGYEARTVPYDEENNSGGLHWWTFMSAYMEIGGDCLMSQIVRIRDKKAHGKPLEKYERQWYRRNQHLVDIKTKYTKEEEDLLKQWT